MPTVFFPIFSNVWFYLTRFNLTWCKLMFLPNIPNFLQTFGQKTNCKWQGTSMSQVHTSGNLCLHNLYLKDYSLLLWYATLKKIITIVSISDSTALELKYFNHSLLYSYFWINIYRMFFFNGPMEIQLPFNSGN